MKIAIVCCLHGNEKYGLKVIKKLPPNIPFFIGNKRALIENKRFIDADLNRIFPGKEKGNYEEKEAYKLIKKLKNFDLIIDLHSTSESCPLFGIITKPNNKKILLAKRLGLKKLVIIPSFYSLDKSLIDHVKRGISLEIGPHERKKNVEEITKVINNLINDVSKNKKIDIYEVFDVIKKQEGDITIKNFYKVKKGEVIVKGNNKQKAKFDFIPVLVGEKAYNDVLCLCCKKFRISRISFC